MVRTGVPWWMVGLVLAVGVGAQEPGVPTEATTAAARAEAPGEEGRFAARRQAWLGQPMLVRSLSSLHGDLIALGGPADRATLVVTVDRDAKDEAVAWLETYAAELARLTRVRLVNLLFPGGVSFVVPRAVAAKQIKKDVDRIQARARAKLSPELQAGWDALAIAWHVDWTRKLVGELGAPRHRLALYLVDPAGAVVMIEDQVDAAAFERVLGRLKGP